MRPETEAEIADLIRQARAPLSVIGGATRLRPGEGQGTRLSIASLIGITLYEPAALTLIARAGTPLAQIEATLAAENQCLAFEPPAAPGSTIGGVIAANASGPRRIKDGAARDSLLGVRFVDGCGEAISNGGRVMKNVTGYDLVRLMAGSRGTLGVLTEVSLRTRPIPPATATLALPTLGAAAAIPALTAALTGPWDVSGAAWLPDHGALIRIEGLAGSVSHRAADLTRRLTVFGPVERLDHPSGLWSANIPGSGAAPRSGGDLWRIVARPSQTATLLARLPQPRSLDWGGGSIHVELPPGDAPDLTSTAARAVRLTGPAAMALPPQPVALRRLDDGIRARFDPRGIFARGVQDADAVHSGTTGRSGHRAG